MVFATYQRMRANGTSWAGPSQYIFVYYDYDTNGILTEQMNNLSESELLRAYTAAHISLV